MVNPRAQLPPSTSGRPAGGHISGWGRSGRGGGGAQPLHVGAARSSRLAARMLADGGASTGAGKKGSKRDGPEPEPYVDNWFDSLLVEYFRGKVEQELGRKMDGDKRGYDAVCEMTHLLNRESGSPQVLQARGKKILATLLPPWFAFVFGRFLKLFPGWFDARHAAASVTFALPWLVGRGKVVDVELEDGPMDDPRAVPSSAASWAVNAGYQPAGYKQGVLVEKCRLLDGTKCASVCVNVCKVPTEAFFNEQVGLPLTMVPDYETMECRFIFGKTPPPPSKDESFETPCLNECPSVKFLRAMEEDRICRGIQVDS